MRFLALDPSKNLGWCHGEPCGTPIHGFHRLAQIQKSKRDVALEVFLMDMITANRITDVYLEKPIMPKKTSFQALVTLYGYATVVGMAAAKTGANAYFIDMQTWRSEIGSPTQAPRQVKGTEARRKWLKQATIDWIAKIYKIQAATDDEADAVGIWKCIDLRQQKVRDEPKFDLFSDLTV